MTAAETLPQQTGSAAIRGLDWFQFEKLVALLFAHEGFAVQRLGGAHADGGLDLIATNEGITFGVQCKHWQAWRVGVKEVRAFFGALHDRGLRHGFIITLKGYTPDAAAFAERHGIELIDEPMLLDNLEAVNWRANFSFLRILHDRQKICPKCESEMVLRTAKKGAQAGKQFWGCSTYPRCDYTMPVEPAR